MNHINVGRSYPDLFNQLSAKAAPQPEDLAISEVGVRRNKEGTGTSLSDPSSCPRTSRQTGAAVGTARVASASQGSRAAVRSSLASQTWL